MEKTPRGALIAWLRPPSRDRAKVPLGTPPLTAVDRRARGPANLEFRQDPYRARELRGDWAFGEEIIRIADDGSSDWKKAANGRPVVDKELVLRSKLRIEARRFHMERLHRDTWGEKLTADITTNYSLMSDDERIREAMELIGVIKEITGPRPKAAGVALRSGRRRPGARARRDRRLTALRVRTHAKRGGLSPGASEGK